MLELFFQHLLAPLAVLAVATAFPWLRKKVRDGATVAWRSAGCLLHSFAHLAAAGTKERRDQRFVARVRAAHQADTEMLGEVIDAHGLALSALHTVVSTILLPEEASKGKKHLPNSAKMLCWFMLYRYLYPRALDLDLGDTKTIAAYRKQHAAEGPGKSTTSLQGHCTDKSKLLDDFIDVMDGGPRLFSRDMNNGTLNIKIVHAFYGSLALTIKCHVWIGDPWAGDEGPKLNHNQAYWAAKDKLAAGGGWKEKQG